MACYWSISGKKNNANGPLKNATSLEKDSKSIGCTFLILLFFVILFFNLSVYPLLV